MYISHLQKPIFKTLVKPLLLIHGLFVLTLIFRLKSKLKDTKDEYHKTLKHGFRSKTSLQTKYHQVPQEKYKNTENVNFSFITDPDKKKTS